MQKAPLGLRGMPFDNSPSEVKKRMNLIRFHIEK
jgi:hypothetical protein